MFTLLTVEEVCHLMAVGRLQETGLGLWLLMEVLLRAPTLSFDHRPAQSGPPVSTDPCPMAGCLSHPAGYQ